MSLLYHSKHIVDAITIDNRRLGIISLKNLFDTLIQKPNVQRIVDHDKVNEIVSTQDNFYKAGNHHFNFLGTINQKKTPKKIQKIN